MGNRSEFIVNRQELGEKAWYRFCKLAYGFATSYLFLGY